MYLRIKTRRPVYMLVSYFNGKGVIGGETTGPLTFFSSSFVSKGLPSSYSSQLTPGKIYDFRIDQVIGKRNFLCCH